MRIPVVLTLVLVSTMYVHAQEVNKRHFNAVRVEDTPKIDGVLEDEVWSQASEVAFDGAFYQISPDNGEPSSYTAQIRIVYTDFAIYIGALLRDPSPETIPRELGIRDDLDKNTDMLGVTFDPYNQGQNGFHYVVTAAGVQGDGVATTRDEDWNWDAVWNSAVGFTDEGWVVEYEIPYSAIRFPKTEVQTWGLNFYRVAKRLNEESTWNFVDNSIEGFLNQAGQLDGLNNIKPPLRLNFSPYLSAGATYDGETGNTTTQYGGGMDLKLGLSESFTLDMSLIPDFSQVQSDNIVLNLSPFEQRLDENRPFFTEGTEMFNKGRIFYSRRVGQSFGHSYEGVGDSEEIQSFPFTAPLVNALKVSGRTSKGTGLGVFNAVTNETYVVAQDTITGERREYLYDPVTNFNVVVWDQNLKYNSNIGIINTNVMRSGGAQDANVTLAQARFRDKSNTYSFFGNVGYSQIFNTGEQELDVYDGFKGLVSISKVSGNFQWQARGSVDSDTWDISDLGYQRGNNEIELGANVRYNIFKPFSIFNRFNSRLSLNYNRLYKPNKYSRFRINANANTQFRNFNSIGCEHRG